MNLSSYERKKIQNNHYRPPFKVVYLERGARLVDSEYTVVQWLVFNGNSKQRRQQRKLYMKQVEQAQLEALLVGGQ